MPTAFTAILQRAVDRTPRALGAIFADWDGEAVDHVCSMSKFDMLVLGAHYGIVLNQVQSALHLFHFGEAEELIFEHDRMDLVVRSVGEGYYLLLVIGEHGHLGVALREAQVAASALKIEMA
jgi:predicted regulator of Ras-like GTPase activity (Roadblock/LC7/MglB family)